MKITKLVIFMFAVTVVIAGLLALLFIIPDQPQKDLETCAIPLKEIGKKTYEIPIDAKTGFQITEISVDPIDVGPGETQTITVWVRDVGNNTITRISGVSARIATDHESRTRHLQLTGAHDEVSSPKKYGPEEALITSWEGLWIRDDTDTDTNCVIYTETITATNNEGDEASFELRFR